MMDIDNYGRAIEELQPVISDKELHNRVINKAQSSKPRRKISKGMSAAVVAAAVFVVGTVAIAAFGGNILSGMLGGSWVSEQVRSNVYEDSDGSVKITVEEYLTDTATAYAVVHYEALTEDGQKWLDEMSAKEGDCDTFVLDQYIDKDNGDSRTGGLIRCAVLMPEYTTETGKRWYLKFSLCTDDYTNGKGRVKLTYPMPAGIKSALFSAEPNVESSFFKLVGEGSPSELFTPTYIRLSKLGYTVIGKTDCLWSDGENALLTSEQLRAAKRAAECVLVMRDGSRIKLGGTIRTTLRKHSDPTLDYADLNISIGSTAYNADGSIAEFAEVVDINEVTGIEIGGIFYSIE